MKYSEKLAKEGKIYVYPYGECKVVSMGEMFMKEEIQYESTEEATYNGKEVRANVYCDWDNNCYAVIDNF